MIRMSPPKRSHYTLRTRTAPSIYDGFQALMFRVARLRLAPLPQAGKGTAEAVLSAIVLDFLSRPEAEQDATIRRVVPEVARRIAAEFAGLDDPESPESSPATVHREAGARPRRKPAG